MPVVFAVSVQLAGKLVDPAELIDTLAVTFTGPVQVDRAGNTVWFMADERSALGELAEPLFAWWQRQGRGAVLRLVGPAGGQEISYITPRSAVPILRQLIETESGPIRQTRKRKAGLHTWFHRNAWGTKR